MRFLRFSLYEILLQCRLKCHLRKLSEQYFALTETLRKYPPAGFLFRTASEDYKVKNSRHVIRKGTQVIVPAYAIHHDPQIYENPSVFDPERFNPEEVEKRHNFAYLPFGEGQRNCLGIYTLIAVKSNRYLILVAR